MKMNFSKPFSFFLLLLCLSTAVFADQSLPQPKGNEVKEPNQGGGGGGGGGYCGHRRCCGSWNYGQCNKWCCSSPADADLEVIEPNQGGGGGGGGGYCRYRRCCSYYGGSCRKWCCSHPVGEAEPAQLVEDSSYNGGGGYGGGGHGGGGYGGGGHGGGGGGHGGGGGRCKYGCCGGHGSGGGYGGCKCCGSAAEAKAFMESKGKEETKN